MNGRKITAAIQMSSTPNKGENLETAERHIHSAVSSGADLVALPEQVPHHAVAWPPLLRGRAHEGDRPGAPEDVAGAHAAERTGRHASGIVHTSIARNAPPAMIAAAEADSATRAESA